jgi:hypothetical protein
LFRFATNHSCRIHVAKATVLYGKGPTWSRRHGKEKGEEELEIENLKPEAIKELRIYLRFSG